MTKPHFRLHVSRKSPFRVPLWRVERLDGSFTDWYTSARQACEAAGR